jgi:hypothetical protein
MGRGVIIAVAMAASLCGGTSLAQNTPPAPAEAQAPNVPAEPQAPSAPPQNAPADPFHGMIGAWEFSNADHDKICHFNFRSDAVAGGYRLDIGMYDGFTPEEGRYILQTAAAAPMRTAEDMVGDWAIARGAGKPICVLTLVNSPAAGVDALALKVKPGCDAAITRFNPAAWRMDQGDLVLLSQRGESWQFEENDANTWQRVPESADPVLLVRQ